MDPGDEGRFGPANDVSGLFDGERERLLDTLASLTADQWSAATVCPGWTVKDIAAHLLGDDVARLARTRDRFSVGGPVGSERLASYLDRLNEEWVVATRRMSPRLLVAQLRWTGTQIAELWSSLPPERPSETVSWAGPGIAPVWLDAARDFSEYWVHRQQIHEALGQPFDDDESVVGRVVDTFMRALPFTLRSVQRPVGTRFTFIVSGPGGGAWTVERLVDHWQLASGGSAGDSSVTVDVDTAWRLATRMVDPAAARDRAIMAGDPELARSALRIVSIVRSP